MPQCRQVRLRPSGTFVDTDINNTLPVGHFSHEAVDYDGTLEAEISLKGLPSSLHIPTMTNVRETIGTTSFIS
jgi:hypothetical protein